MSVDYEKFTKTISKGKFGTILNWSMVLEMGTMYGRPAVICRVEKYCRTITILEMTTKIKLHTCTAPLTKKLEKHTAKILHTNIKILKSFTG
jgi:hypothetical protein